MKMAVGEGMEIVQNFDPLPLYEVMDGLGFERHTEKVTETEYHAYFYRTEVISFLKEHGKFKPTNDGFTADAGKVCEHE